MSGVKSLLRRLRRSSSGLAATELALSLPFMLTASMWGVELANYGVTMMRVNQLAIHMADNASRVGDTSILANRKVYESDIMDLLQGAHIQGGRQIDFFEHGRAIISSLQVDDDENQYINWQRCMGTKRWSSTYGDVGDRLPSGMGPSGREVIAFDDEAVMFVELAYDYQPLISGRFVGTPVIKSVASFTVRSDRDLSGLFQRDTSNPDPVADCANYTNPFGGGGGGAGGDGGGSTSTSSGGSGGASSGGSGSTSTSGGSTSTSSSTTSSTSGGGTTTTSGGSTTTSSSTTSGGGTTTTSGGSTTTSSTTTSGGGTTTTSGGSTTTSSTTTSGGGTTTSSGGTSSWGGSSWGGSSWGGSSWGGSSRGGSSGRGWR